MKMFVSYTIRDGYITESLLKKIQELLSSFGETYIDLLNNSYMKGQDKVINELHSSDLMILLNTYKAKESEWVKFEIEYANQNQIPIVELTPYEIENINVNILENKMYAIFSNVN